jgi:putative flippase GtrA
MIIANLIDKFPRPFKFAIVGGVAATVHFCIVLLLVETLQLHPLLANIFAFFVAFCVSFSGQRLFTFADRQRTLKESIGPYFLISATGFIANELLFIVALYYFETPYQLALFMVLLIVAIGTYLGSKYWAFSISKT